MSWQTNRESYVVKKPNLQQLIGDELQNGLLIYHKWCNQLLTIRYTSIALMFFVFGIFGIYLINLPLYIFNLNNIDYLSFSGLWNVICMVSILTVHLYYNSIHFEISNNNNSTQIINIRTWWTLLPLISYPFCSLCCSSFYLSWIGIPFLSTINSINSSSNTDINDNINDNTIITIIQYSILLLSYIYGYIPHELLNGNKIYFKLIQPKRSIYFKQILIKSLISNFIQSIIYCICCILMWWFLQILFFDFNLTLSSSYIIFGILFRITMSINFLWMIGYLIQNRLLTEKVDMSRYNGSQYPLIHNSTNGRCIDIRLLGLTHSYSDTYNIKKEREYFCYLALIELLDVVQFDEKQRKLIYSTQIYYNIIVETLLSKYTTFITSLYDHIYGNKPNKSRLLSSSSSTSSFFGNKWYKQFTLKPEIKGIFKDYEILIHSADILSFLIIHSLEEDELGIVQESLEQILCVLLECLDILDIFLKSDIYKIIFGKKGFNQKNKIINTLYKGIETSLMRIIMKMHKYLESLKLPQKNAQRLQSYLVQ